MYEETGDCYYPSAIFRYLIGDTDEDRFNCKLLDIARCSAGT